MMSFDQSAFEKEARARWGNTEAFREFEQKTAGRSKTQEDEHGKAFMQLFCDLGALQGGDPAGEPAQAKVKELQQFITDHWYTCTDEILQGLGQLYTCDGAFRERIDATGGAGTADFAAEAIRQFCSR